MLNSYVDIKEQLTKHVNYTYVHLGIPYINLNSSNTKYIKYIMYKIKYLSNLYEHTFAFFFFLVGISVFKILRTHERGIGVRCVGIMCCGVFVLRFFIIRKFKKFKDYRETFGLHF